MKKDFIAEHRRAQKHRELARYYSLNSILGNDWAIFFVIVGARKTGKSYSVTDFLCRRKKMLGEQCKNYWMRISETSTKAMLANKADKLVDPDLKRKYNLDLSTKGMTVFDHKQRFMEVIPLSSFGKLKGVGFYDKDYTGEYNIVLDEFQLEQGEKRTSFDILYNFLGMCENLVRTTKSKIRVFLLGNTLEEASTVLKAFNFLPEKFGRFYLKSKRCVIDNIEPTEEYMKDRKGSIADILGGEDMSNFSNVIEKNLRTISKKKVHRIQAVIRFGKEKNSWYCWWDGNIIKRYNNNPYKKDLEYNMRPYLDGRYTPEKVRQIVELFDAEMFKFDTLITQSYFIEDLSRIRK